MNKKVRIRFAGIKGKVYCLKSMEDIMDMEGKTGRDCKGCGRQEARVLKC